MTALNELKKLITENQIKLDEKVFDKSGKTYLAMTLTAGFILKKIEKLLEKEKQQIVNAFQIGDNNYPHGNGYDSGEQYFKQNYENN